MRKSIVVLARRCRGCGGDRGKGRKWREGVRGRQLHGVRRSRGAAGVPRADRRVQEGEPDVTMQAHRSQRSRRPDRAVVDRVLSRHPARPVPDELPLLRAVRRQWRPRAREERVDARTSSSGGLLPTGDGSVPGRRQADLHATEHLEPRRLLQQGPVRPGGRGRAGGGLDMGRHARRGQGPDEGPGRRRRSRVRPRHGASIIRSRPSSGPTAASSSTTRSSRHGSRWTRPRPWRRCRTSSTCTWSTR